MSAGLTLGVVVGVLVVGVLILAFVLGARRKDREPIPDRSPHSPERESWSTPSSTPGHAPLGDSEDPVHLKFRR